MTRYYAVSDVDVVHLTFAPVASRTWPHMLCNTPPISPADSAQVPTCLLCVGLAQRYDEQLGRASMTNPCAEVDLAP